MKLKFSLPFISLQFLILAIFSNCKVYAQCLGPFPPGAISESVFRNAAMIAGAQVNPASNPPGFVVKSITSMYINDVLTLSDNLTLQDCNISFGPNGKIVVPMNSGLTLTLSSTVLSSCGADMWHGIELTSNKEKVVCNAAGFSRINTSIGDAEYGIKLMNGAQFDVQNTTFWANWTGLYFDGPASSGGTYNFIHNDINYDPNTNHAAGVIKNTPLNSYIASTQPNIGLWIRNNDSPQPITIGGSASLPRNFFTSTNCAIFIEAAAAACNVSVLGNDFADILGIFASCSHFPVYYGSEVYFSSLITPSYPSNCSLQVGDGSTSNANNSRFNTYCVNSNGFVNLNIIGNNWAEVEKSWVNIINNPKSSITINNNTGNLLTCVPNGSSTVPNGIIIQNSLNTMGVQINNNNFSPICSLSLANNLATPSIGIFLNSVSSGSAISIRGNKIQNTSFGIYSYATSNIVAYSNTISLRTALYSSSALPQPDGSLNASQPYWSGITDVAGANNAYLTNTITVDNNILTANSGPVIYPDYPAFPNQNGRLYGFLDVARVGPITVQCDSFANLHWGIASCYSTGAPILTVHNNASYQNYVGMANFNGGYFGPQGSVNNASDNRWYLGSQYRAPFMNRHFSVINHQYPVGAYYSDGTHSPFYMRGYPAEYSPSWTTELPTPWGNSVSFSNPLCRALNSPVECHPTLAVPIGSARLAIHNYDPNLLEMMASGDLSFTGMDASSTDKWIAERLASAIRQYPDLKDSLPVLDSFAVATAQSSYVQLMMINDSLGMDSLDATAIEAMIDKNGIIYPTDQNEQNMQIINDIYLNTFAQGQYELDAPTLDIVRSIAQQCYVTGGPSVFRARSLYWAATNTNDMSFQDDCLANYGSFRLQKPQLVDSNKFKAYPNPLAADQSFVLETDENGSVTFYDAVGQIIFSGKLVAGKNLFDCSQIDCSTYLLIFKCQMNSGKIHSGKLSIIR